MDSPLGDEIESDPVAPGLDVIADVKQVGVRGGILDEELDHKSGCNEEKDQEDVSGEREEQELAETVSNPRNGQRLRIRRARLTMSVLHSLDGREATDDCAPLSRWHIGGVVLLLVLFLVLLVKLTREFIVHVPVVVVKGRIVVLFLVV